MNNIQIRNYDITLKFDEAVTQQISSFQRIYGLVKVRQLVELIGVVDLDSNPRNSRAGSITADIVESLERFPETFPLMSKGILLSTTNFRRAERDRYQLKFDDKNIEGVLDGGHNLLAVGLYVLGEALSEAAISEKIGTRVVFSDFKRLFKQYFAEIDAYLRDPKNSRVVDGFVPLELILPLSNDDADLVAFRDHLPLIQQARNNNAQLKNQTLADHAGIFEELKSAIEPKLRDLIEWKTNDGGVVDVRDLVALTWIVLPELDFDVRDKGEKRISPPAVQQLYSSKATVLNRYIEFMESPDVGTIPRGDKYELKNEKVRDALKLAATLPNLFEAVSEMVEQIFNNSSPRSKFADLTVVVASNKRKDPVHKFSRTPAPLIVPDGFVWPVVAGFRSLIERDNDGNLSWGKDPVLFLRDHWEELSDSYFTILDGGQYDPQKVGKSKMSYDLFYSKIEAIYRRNK